MSLVCEALIIANPIKSWNPRVLTSFLLINRWKWNFLKKHVAISYCYQFSNVKNPIFFLYPFFVSLSILTFPLSRILFFFLRHVFVFLAPLSGQFHPPLLALFLPVDILLVESVNVAIKVSNRIFLQSLRDISFPRFSNSNLPADIYRAFNDS